MLEEILRHRPAVHQLCAGAFLQEALYLGSSLWAVPLQGLGLGTEAEVTARYATEVLGAPVDTAAVAALKEQGVSARPLVALIFHAQLDYATGAQLEAAARSTLERGRLLLSWSTGDRPEPVAVLTASGAQCFFRLALPHSRNRQRLGLGNERDPHEASLKALHALLETDERFAFAMTLFRDALREENAEFRAARQFAVLEALTYRIKHRHGDRSRAAVRDLLGLAEGAKVTLGVDGDNVTFDRVEVAGRIRDKLFHGVPFSDAELDGESRRAVEYMRKHPEQLGDLLQDDCELELMRWAHGISRGQAL